MDMQAKCLRACPLFGVGRQKGDWRSKAFLEYQGGCNVKRVGRPRRGVAQYVFGSPKH